MAILIDNVYQQVLAIANKEQRGYITPQEFNLFARKAQLDIFENSFHDYKMALLKPQHQHKLADDIDMLKEKIAPFRNTSGTLAWNGSDGTQGTISSTCHWLENVYDGNSYRTVEITFPASSSVDDDDLLNLRAIYDGTGSITEGEGDFTIGFNKSGGTPSDGSYIGSGVLWLHIEPGYTSEQVAGRFINVINDTSPYHSAAIKSGAASTVILTYLQEGITGSESAEDNFATFANISTTTSYATYEEVDKQDWLYITSGGAKLKPLSDRPVFYRKTKVQLGFYPPLTGNIKHDFISKPADPKWTYSVINGKALYNSSAADKQDFELHASEEGSLVNKILELSGLLIEKPILAESALRNEATNEADKNN
jgi:hypothetical protein